MPRVSTRVVLGITSLRVIERDSYLYDGPLELAKGGNSKQEMQRANQLSDQQIGIMRDQLAMQKQQLGMVNPALQSIIQNRGMLPEQEAAMRTQAMQGLGQQYSSLQGQLSQQLAARGITGGGMAGGGDIAKSFGALGSWEAGQQSDLLNQIQLAKGQGLQSAIGLGLGEGGMFGSQALGFGSQGVNALGIGQQAGQAADQASTGFWGSLVGGLAGLGGQLGSAGIAKCWVAAELYGGWFTAETIYLRAWIFSTWWMAPFAWFYRIFGERWARAIRRNVMLRRTTKRLFDWFLSKACA